MNKQYVHFTYILLFPKFYFNNTLKALESPWQLQIFSAVQTIISTRWKINVKILNNNATYKNTL